MAASPLFTDYIIALFGGERSREKISNSSEVSGGWSLGTKFILFVIRSIYMNDST